MTNVLHIIHCLTGGGATRAMAAVAKQSAASGPYHHSVLSILPPTKAGRELVSEAGMEPAIPGPEKSVRQHIEAADIVHLHFWNSPELYRFLDARFPAMRLVVWFHIAGDNAPHVITSALIDFADVALACSPYQLTLPAFRALSDEEQAHKVDLVIAPPELARLQEIVPRPHKGFNVGYIGTLDPVKIHPDYFEMSAAIDIPGITFPICGAGAGETELRDKVKKHGLEERFKFLGFVEDIGAVIAELDVLGYPLCEGNYSAADLVLQEVMYAGVPPVIFPHGGTTALVEHGETGLIVEDAKAYKKAIRHLYADPDLRRRLGSNAQRHARQHFGPKIGAERLHSLYQRLLQRPKTLRDPLRSSDVRPNTNGLSVKGAQSFVNGLGDQSPAFATSLHESDPEAVITAEKTIAAAGPLLRGPSSGGVFHYRAAYPEDPYLCLWCGLMLQSDGAHVRAFIELKRAIELGFDHWRLQGYLARSASNIGAAEVAAAALARVRAEAPAHLADFGDDV